MSATEPGLPASGPADPDAPKLVLPGRSLRAGAGTDWIGEGWRLFCKAKLMWIIFVFLFLLIHIALAFVPLLGSLAANILSPVLAGGVYLGCRSLETGGELELEHLFAGFRRHFGDLVLIGVAYLLGGIAILLVFGMFAGMSIVSAMLAGHQGDVLSSVMAASVPLAIGALVATALSVPLVAAYWFAPMLVMLNGVKPVDAMKASLVACFRNLLPFLVYSILMLLLAILAMIPVGLGLFVWAPLLVASMYASYRGVFTEPD
jgi:uncharacterized membrane protein